MYGFDNKIPEAKEEIEKNLSLPKFVERILLYDFISQFEPQSKNEANE